MLHAKKRGIERSLGLNLKGELEAFVKSAESAEYVAKRSINGGAKDYADAGYYNIKAGEILLKNGAKREASRYFTKAEQNYRDAAKKAITEEQRRNYEEKAERIKNATKSLREHLAKERLSLRKYSQEIVVGLLFVLSMVFSQAGITGYSVAERWLNHSNSLGLIAFIFGLVGLLVLLEEKK